MDKIWLCWILIELKVENNLLERRKAVSLLFLSNNFYELIAFNFCFPQKLDENQSYCNTSYSSTQQKRNTAYNLPICTAPYLPALSEV